MSSRLIAPVLLAGALSLTAGAQIRSSGLEDVSGWTSNLLERGETAISDRVWASSEADFLLSLMEGLNVEEMTEAERELLSRLLRSPSAKPSGEGADALQAERLRLLESLGERRAVAMLGRQVDEVPDGVDADAIIADNRLAAGELGLVCDQMNPEAADRFWLELRIICGVESGNLAEAELALELAAGEEGADPWVTETAIAIIAEADERPEARFGSGLQVALSQLAELEVTADALEAARPDLAAGYANDTRNPLALRLVAARNATSAGLLDSPQYRSLYLDYVNAPGFEPETPADEALYLLTQEPRPMSQPARDLRNEGTLDIEDEAFELGMDSPQASLETRQADALVAALEAASDNAVDYRTMAGLFQEDLKSFPVDAVTASQALEFANAALALQNASLTNFWLDAAEDAAGGASRQTARMCGYSMVLSRERDRGAVEAVVSQLVGDDASPEAEADALKLFSIWAGFDISLPVAARKALVDASADEAGTPGGALVAMEAAARGGAHGEAILLLLNATDGAPGELSPMTLQAVISTLRRFGAEADAQALALEVAGFQP